MVGLNEDRECLNMRKLICYAAMILALSIFIMSPFLNRYFIDTGESIGQITRVIELNRGLREGSWYPRWFGDLAGGFGIPYFVFYSPLIYYISAFFHFLGFGILGSLKCMILLGILLSGVGMFILANSIWGKYGAMISAIAFIYAPYRMVDLFIRGDLAEAFGMSLLPLLFYFFYQVVQRQKFGDLALASVFYAMLICTHNCMALISSGFLLVFVVFISIQNRSLKGLLLSFAGMFWAYGLSAVFWFPALWEKKWVNIHLIYSNPTFDFHNQFLEFYRLLSPVWTFEVGLGGKSLPFQIGVPHLLLAVLSFGFIMKLDSNKENKIKELWLFLCLMVIAGIFLTNMASTALWENLPLMRYLQFPYRFLGPISFLVSLLAGGLFCLFENENENLKWMFLSVLLIAIITGTAQFCRPSRYVVFSEQMLTANFVRTLGGTVSAYNREAMDRIIDYGEYLPRTVIRLPDKRNAGKVFSVSGNPVIQDLKVWMHKYRFVVTGNQESEIVAGSFFYPTWKALINGRKGSLFTDDEGLIHVRVPKGKSEVVIFFDDSLARKASKYVSIGLFVFMIAAMLWLILKAVSTSQRRNI